MYAGGGRVTTPKTIRTTGLANTLDTIQKTLELLGGERKEGAILALNAVRARYGIPLEGQQLELFDEKSGKR
jgi:hypothetical protein